MVHYRLATCFVPRPKPERGWMRFGIDDRGELVSSHRLALTASIGE